MLCELKKPSTVNIVPQRLIQLFREHGIEASQIPRIFPKFSLSDLSSDESLLKKLTPELIDEIATLFSVRSEWLEGVDDIVYSAYSCYNEPTRFFDLFNKVKHLGMNFPARVITCAENLNSQVRDSQPILLIVLDEIALLGDEVIYRYYIIDGEWNWSHSPCRIQLKAFARLLNRKLSIVTPIFKVDVKTFQEIAECRKIPREYIDGGLVTDPSLEDYALSKIESVVAKETEELPEVLKYINDHKLNNLVLNQLSGLDDNAREFEGNKGTLKQKSSHHQNAALSKHQKTYDLKRECIKYWLAHQSFSNDEAAKRFYKQLPLGKQNLLTSSNAASTLTRAISEYRNREKLEQQNKTPKWLIGFNPLM